MSSLPDLQGNPLPQGQAPASTSGTVNPNTIQTQGNPAILQNANISTLTVVGDKQPDPSTFPVADVVVVAIILIAAVIGVLAWFKD